MNTTLILGVSFVLFLVALPLASFGTNEDNEVLWWVALALLLVAGVLPPATRFLGAKEQGDAEEEKRFVDDGVNETERASTDGGPRPDHPRATDPPRRKAGDRPRAVEQRERADEVGRGTDDEGDRA